ncbi:MAG: hypothetical protein COA99_19600 [Moraxellaceae bacterium]|nr:MAG: hypothetical protein COA99_19600 [Moraxellaceae bacterium]
MDKRQWQAHVSKHSTSGLSKSAYAKQHGLVYCNFIYWTKKLAQQSPDAFVVVNVTSSNTVKLKTESKSVIETAEILGVLEFPNDTRLVIHSPELVAQLPFLLTGNV